ncbi:MAG: hypothetical protein HY646_12170 [Acidobacteria bacterium]|nr:hypothetical protein [Acidobacteriota bacterium]
MRESSDLIFPPIPKGWGLPFYYASLSSFMLFFRADASTLRLFLRGTGLKPARFSDVPDGLGMISIEFQNYTAQGSNFMSVTSEVEFNIISYPEAEEKRVPVMPFDQFVYGLDQTKLIGGIRVYVPCDNQVAVNAGREIFGEQKFLTTFDFNVPSLNTGTKPADYYVNPPMHQWQYTVHDPDFKPPAPPAPCNHKPKDVIYQVDATIPSLEQCANPSPLTLYSMWPNKTGKLVGEKGYAGMDVKLTGSRWNIWGTFKAFFPNADEQEGIRLTLGKSKHQMRESMETLLGPSPKASAVRIYQSEPVAAENRAFYAV